MADLYGYIAANQASGAYAWGQLSFAGTATNASIAALRSMLTGVGWSQPTLTDGDLDGTLATTTVAPDGWPYHATGDTSPCVPDISGAALVGQFGGYYFIFFDPYSTTPIQPDPTGTIFGGLEVIGVPCGSSVLDTQTNFVERADGNTPWTWTFQGDALVIVIAKHAGPAANVDPASIDGFWSPSLDNWFVGGNAPSGGGWNVYSAAAPATGDVMRLRLYESSNNDGIMCIDVAMPYAALVAIEGNAASYISGGFAWDLTTPGSILGIAGVTNIAGAPLVIETGLPHGFAVGDYIFLNGIDGIAFLEGAFCVAAVPSTTTCQLAQIITYQFTVSSVDTRTGEQAFAVFNIAAGPYQIALGLLPYTDTDLGGTAMLAAALNVPSAMGPVVVSVAGVPTLSPAVIQTTAPHGLMIQDRVKLAGILGATNLNGPWWVARVPSADTLELSNAPLTFQFGNGDAYTGGGSVSNETTPGGPISIAEVTNAGSGPVIIETSSPHGCIPGDAVAISGVGGISFLDAAWTVGEVLSPTTFEIASLAVMVDAITAYTSGGTVTSGIFNAMFATNQIVAAGNLYDEGQGTAIAAQGIWGVFSESARTLAAYSVALPVPMTGTPGDGNTTAGKSIVLAPYVSLRIANGQEARIAGTLWDSFIQLQNIPYGTQESYDGVTFFAWAATGSQPGDFFNATLFLRAQN